MENFMEKDVRVFGRVAATRNLTEAEIDLVGGADPGHEHTSSCTLWSSSGCERREIDDKIVPHAGFGGGS